MQVPAASKNCSLLQRHDRLARDLQLDAVAALVAQVNAQVGGLWAETSEATRETPARTLNMATILSEEERFFVFVKRGVLS